MLREAFSSVEHSARGVHDVISGQARLTPDAIAVRCSGRTLTYRELEARSNRLARYLRKLGVGSDTIVGVALPRDLDLIVGLIAILKAGGAYTPLTGEFPREHHRQVLADTGSRFALTTRGIALEVSGTQAQIIDIEDPAIDTCSSADADWQTDPSALAYVIFTSGSTGAPKGVMIEQKSLVSFVMWARSRFTKEQFSGVLAATTLAFDVSVFEIFAPLAAGGTVLLVNSLINTDEAKSLPVTMISASATSLSEALRLGTLPTQARTILQAGERLTLDLTRELFARTQVEELINLCGSTEDTVYSVFYLVPRTIAEDPPIGQAFTDRRVYILDDKQQPVADGVHGEICYAGSGVARGYLNLPELTAQRFVRDPFSDDPNDRMYRTGDIAFRRSDGNITYVGRNDTQLKVRGIRIEPAQIEALLREHKGVTNAVVTLRRVHGEERLCAFYVPAAEAVNAVELAAHCATTLHAGVVPSFFIPIAALPLSPSGKIDLGALPDPTFAKLVDRSHWSAMELVVAGAFSEVLQFETFERDDNFFIIGGHSLAAARVVALLADARHIDRSDPVLLEAFRKEPTVAGIAAALDTIDVRDAARNQPSDLPPVVRIFERGDADETPLIFFEGDIIGDASYCWRIAHALGRRIPFYGIPSEGRDDSPVAPTIEAMADRAMALVRNIRSTGPYRLGGYCAGGILALEIAARLRREGETVEYLGLISTDTGILRYGLTRHVVAFASKLLRRDPAHSTARVTRFLNALRRMSARLERDPVEALRWLDYRLLRYRRSEKTYVFDTIVDALGVYTAPDYDGPLVLVWGKDTDHDTCDAVQRRWSARYPQAQVRFVPGDHFGIITHSNDVARALSLTPEIRDAESAPASR